MLCSLLSIYCRFEFLQSWHQYNTYYEFKKTYFMKKNEGKSLAEVLHSLCVFLCLWVSRASIMFVCLFVSVLAFLVTIYQNLNTFYLPLFKKVSQRSVLDRRLRPSRSDSNILKQPHKLILKHNLESPLNLTYVSVHTVVFKIIPV